MNAFSVDQTEAALGLALYVLGYGTGCLFLSPLTEIPRIGRNPPYAASGFLFIILCIPGALIQNYPGFMVLRFLIGLMASPPLATSGATLSDIWSYESFPFAIGIWSATTAMGPALGPTLSSYAVRDLGWRFASWELLIIAGPSYLLLFLTVPETSALTILYNRAKRLRESSGDMTIRSVAEIKQEHLKLSSVLWDALIKPWEMNLKDPALMFTTFYFGLIYGIYYTFFEASFDSMASHLETNPCITVSAVGFPRHIWLLQREYGSGFSSCRAGRLSRRWASRALSQVCTAQDAVWLFRRIGEPSSTGYGI